ncbi:Protein of unknown function [Micromonospora lupini str. Lupac 08]|uniref:Uncharacterized protein n=1 Tax=Micromonospora lupini str. Lupac 08 TaxID=1150864 RepID=I0KVJ6_9ACTN|nr:Protein of unknown function [Micromonospora lupini str. Lupac 08]
MHACRLHASLPPTFSRPGVLGHCLPPVELPRLWGTVPVTAGGVKGGGVDAVTAVVRWAPVTGGGAGCR